MCIRQTTFKLQLAFQNSEKQTPEVIRVKYQQIELNEGLKSKSNEIF